MMPPRKHSSSRASNKNNNNKLGDNKGHNNNSNSNRRAQQQSAKRRRQLNENRSKAVPDIHSTVALLPPLPLSPCPTTTPFCPFLLQLNNFHSLSAGGQWTAASWQLFRVQQQIKFALVIGFQNTSTTAVFNAANSRRSFPHTHTQTVGHTHINTQSGTQRDTLGDFRRVGHENRRAAAVDVELSKALGQHFACGLPLPLLLPDCLAACLPLPRPPYAVVMLPSLTELWPRKCKPCRSRSRIRSRTTPRPHPHSHRCLRPTRAAYPLAQLAAFLCRSFSLPPSLFPLPSCSACHFDWQI